MREINNSINQTNFTGIQKPQETNQTTDSKSQAEEESKEIKDLSALPSAALGKSQITSDSTENDMAIFAKYPEQVKQINALVDNFRATHTPEETAQFIEACRNELLQK